MKFRFFTIAAQAPESDQQALNSFCSEHRVLAVDRHFVAAGGDSYWALCVSYVEGKGSLKAAVDGRRARVDYREVLNEQDFAVYAALRELRKRLADQEAVPAYAVLTNEQLAEMVTRRTTSLAAMAEIEGVGKARVDKYGKAFLAILHNAFALPADSAAQLPAGTSGDASAESAAAQA